MSVAAGYIDPKSLKSLSVLAPWRTVLAIVVDWLVIAACIVISQAAQNIFVYLLAIAFIGGRMHAFGVLMHEFAHFRFIGNKKVSDWICDIFVAWPILTTVEAYRRNHLAHHRYTNTEKDPDWVIKLGTTKFTFPQKWQTAAISLMGYLAVIGSIFDLAQIVRRLKNLDTSPVIYRLARLNFYLVWAAIFTVTGTWSQVLLYWVIPYMTVFFFLLYVRSVAEHFGSTMDYDHELTGTRSVVPYFWENWFFSPHHVNYHLEHHLYPSVPFYNLPALHRELLKHPGYAARAHLTKGYTVGLVRETLA